MNIIARVFESMTDDDSVSENDNEIIIDEYVNSDEDMRKKIDTIFIALCGWSLKTLIEENL